MDFNDFDYAYEKIKAAKELILEQAYAVYSLKPDRCLDVVMTMVRRKGDDNRYFIANLVDHGLERSEWVKKKQSKENGWHTILEAMHELYFIIIARKAEETPPPEKKKKKKRSKMKRSKESSSEDESSEGSTSEDET